jgi:ATP-binding cassette subfamily F protein 3
MRHALTRALAGYEGSLVLVSHDRALLRTVCDGFLLVTDGAARPFDGDVDDYLAWLTERRARDATPGSATAGSDRETRRAQRESAAAERQAKLAQRRPLVREAGELERSMASLEAEKSTLEARLTDAGFYAGADPTEVQAVTRRCGEVVRLLGQAEDRWLQVQVELESIGEP